jgi:cysteine desulfurase/selenocysteine lyase
MNAAVTSGTKRPFDIEKIRADFPILSRTVYGKPLVYLDSAASAQKPDAVIDAESRVYRHAYANINRSAHALAGEATLAFEAARGKVARFLNARSADEIIFVRGATEAINLVARSFVIPKLSPGDEILLTELEHHSNIVPWVMAAKETGAKVVAAPLRDDGSINAGDMRAMMNDRTKFVAIAHASNVLGTVLPVAEIIQSAHARGIPVLVDGCQMAPHDQIDVQAMDADFYVFSGHKTYGPSGIGALYGKAQYLNAMPPYQGGGSMIDEVAFDRVTFAPPPARFEAGTPAIAQAIALGAALDYIGSFEWAAIHAHEMDLLDYATQRLGEVNSLRIFGRAVERAAIIAFEMPGIHAHDLATIVDREGVAVRAGHHCAQPLMKRLGVVATARASFGIYNTRAEIDVLIAALRRAGELFS